MKTVLKGIINAVSLDSELDAPLKFELLTDYTTVVLKIEGRPDRTATKEDGAGSLEAPPSYFKNMKDYTAGHIQTGELYKAILNTLWPEVLNPVSQVEN